LTSFGSTFRDGIPAVPPKVMLPSYLTVDPLGSVTSVPEVPLPPP